MVKIINRYYFIKYIIILFLPLFFIYISTEFKLWSNFWDFFYFIPYQNPPFSDFEAIQNAIISKKNGFNPYYLNPFDISGHKYMYPSIWLSFFTFLQLYLKYFNFIVTYLILFIYFFVIVNFFEKFKNLLFRVLFILFIFSTSNFLLLERLNIELIIFCLIYFCITNKNLVYKFIFFNLAVIGKIFPFFSILLFANNKKFFLLVLLSSFLLFYLNFDEILLMRKNMIEYALIIAYGIPSMTRSLYHYSKAFDLFINDNNYFLFRNITIILCLIFVFIIFCISYFIHKYKKNFFFLEDEKFFLSGAGIYIGTFITSSNIDYRLIFLTFTIPYITKNINNFFTILFLFSFFISINSLIFEGGDRFGLLYPIKASLVIFSKIYILCYLSFIIGKIFKEKSLLRF
jgi:hypothetical protein